MIRIDTYLLALGIVFLTGAAYGRPRQYTPLDLVHAAPLIIEGEVRTRLNQGAIIEVRAVIKGSSGLTDLRLNDVPRAIPDTPGLRFLPGEHLLLFLKSVERLYTDDHQSALDLTGSTRMAELVRLYLSAVQNDGKHATDVTMELVEALEDYHDLSTLERRFLLQVIGRSAVKVPRATIDQLLEWGMTDTTANVRWEAFAEARRLGLVLEKKSQFLRALQDADRRVRSVSFSALREKVGKTFGYDPALSPEQQADAVESWRSWVARD